jgi:peptide/nickel transport system permease protein
MDYIVPSRCHPPLTAQWSWLRLRHDRVALLSGIVSALLVVIALAAPLIGLPGLRPRTVIGDDHCGHSGMPYFVAR